MGGSSLRIAYSGVQKYRVIPLLKSTQLQPKYSKSSGSSPKNSGGVHRGRPDRTDHLDLWLAPSSSKASIARVALLRLPRASALRICHRFLSIWNVSRSSSPSACPLRLSV